MLFFGTVFQTKVFTTVVNIYLDYATNLIDDNVYVTLNEDYKTQQYLNVVCKCYNDCLNLIFLFRLKIY